MEEKKISEKESLELISQMIQQTKNRIAVGSGKPFIVWGVVMMMVAVVVGLGILLTGNGMWMWGYFAIPVLGYLYQYINQRQVRKSVQPQVKTYIEENLQLVWKGIGTILLSYPAIILVLRFNEPRAWIGMYFIGAFMPMVGAYLTCLMLKIHKINYYIGLPMGMCLMMLSDLFINQTMTNNYNFFFAVLSFFSLVVPGIIINKEAHNSNVKRNDNI